MRSRAVGVADRLHLHVVGHHHALETKGVAQDAGDGGAGEGGGVVRVEQGVEQVAGHDHVHAALGQEQFVGREFGRRTMLR